VQNQTNAQPCSQDQKKAYIGYYNANITTFDLFLANLDLSRMNCYFQVFLVDGIHKTVMWIDFSDSGFEGYKNLYISHSNASELPSFEENLEIPLLNGSLNEVLLQEKQGDSKRDDRVFEFLKPLVMEAFNDFEVSKKYEYYETLFLMNRINLDKLMNVMITDFFGVFLVKEQEFIYDNFQKDLVAAAVRLGKDILPKLNAEFQQVLDDTVAKRTFYKISNDLNYVKQEFVKIQNVLAACENPESVSYGRNEVSKKMNFLYNKITLDDLKNFIRDFEITIDKKKDLDYVFELNDKEVNKKNILKYMNTIPFYKIQFFLLEKFEIIKYKRNDRNGYSMFNRAPKDNCGLTENKIMRFLNLGVEEKAVLSSMLTTDLKNTFIGCDKIVQGNQELYQMYLLPNNDQYCELMILQKDLGEQQFSTEVLLDTYPIKQKYVSCMRYCRGVVQKSMYLLI